MHDYLPAFENGLTDAKSKLRQGTDFNSKLRQVGM
jgi:hypothetical protein